MQFCNIRLFAGLCRCKSTSRHCGDYLASLCVSSITRETAVVYVSVFHRDIFFAIAAPNLAGNKHYKAGFHLFLRTALPLACQMWAVVASLPVSPSGFSLILQNLGGETDGESEQADNRADKEAVKLLSVCLSGKHQQHEHGKNAS